MGVRSWLSSRSAGRRQEYAPVELTPADIDALADPFEREAVVARPHRDNSGIPAMEDVLESLHTVDGHSPRFSSSVENVSPTFAFEMRYGADATHGAERTLTLQYLSTADQTDGLLERQLQHRYPDSHIERRAAPFCNVDAGQYAAGATLNLRKYTLFPIQNIRLDGWRSDPTGGIMTEMARTDSGEEDDATVICQIMFKPARRDWLHGVSEGHGVGRDLENDRIAVDKSNAPGVRELARQLTEPVVKRNVIFPWHWVMPWEWEYYEDPPSRKDKAIAGMLEELDGKAWRMMPRIFAVAPDPDVAVSRASKTADMWRNFYEYRGDQTFLPQPLDGEDLRDEFHSAADREWRESGIVKPQVEVAGVVNIPEAQHVSTNKLRWSMATAGDGVPPGTPRFDFEAVGLGEATQAEKQIAMLDVDDPTAPYWFGFGTKHGIEAGVTHDTLTTHAFVGGGTGSGKSTFLANLVSQIFQRRYGALVFDPKGMDADAFIREWPEDRPPEEFIFVDLSDDFEKQVRFNFLEVPTDAPPDSRAFATAVEALCDDLVAMLAQAGGSENYWGPLMNRVARTLIRGMAKSDRTCTLLDLACCCAAPENRRQFHEWMSEERIHFIEEAARRIRQKEEEDLEPLAGRLDQWIQNDAIRNLISATESTVSLQDVVEEGKVLVVRNAPSSGETEKRLFATALIRRAWVAVREAEDAPPFHVVCDEFDSIVTEQSNIHKILSEARAFEFCLTLACQNPSNQLPEQVAHALTNQCETFITYNPGGKRDAKLIQAQHSPAVGWEDLVNLSKYRFYMRTHDNNDELTHSYKVDAFPPAADVRKEVTGKPGMSDEDLQWFKRRSIARNGTERPTPMQQKAESHFYSLGREEMDHAPSDGSPGLALTEERKHQICKAVFDEGIQNGDDDGFAPAPACAERMREYLAVDIEPDHEEVIWDLVDEIGELYLERDVRDDDVHLRCTAQGQIPIFRTGAAANSGGAAHRELLKDLYEPLTALGTRVEVLEQEGTDQPDGLVHDDGRTIVIEAESSTGESKPARTLFNLAQAVNDGHHCLISCRPDVAPRIWDTLTDPAYSTQYGPLDGRRFFNHRNLYIDGELMLRPATGRETAWTVDPDSGEYLLCDESGSEHARFPDAAAIYEASDRYPATTADVSRDSPDWRPVKEPFIPAAAFDGEPPDAAAWAIVIVPPDAAAPDDLRLYTHGAEVAFEQAAALGRDSATQLTDSMSDTAAENDDDMDDFSLPRL